MAIKINTVNRRRLLKPRKTPYFDTVGKGKAIGFYRTIKGGTWHARFRGSDNKQVYKALGGDIDSEYDDKLKDANDWFVEVQTVGATKYTVKDCLADYVDHLKVEKGEKAANSAKQMLEKHLTPVLGKKRLTDLTTQQFKKWRDGLVRVSGDAEDVRRSKDTANRILSQAKAALNLAYRSGVISSDAAWRRVTAFRDVGEARKLFLTDKQVKGLLENTSGGLHKLVKAGLLTGARYGELAGIRVSDLDKRHGTLKVTGKTGTRDCYLSDDALAYLQSLAKHKLPDAWLLVKDDGEPWGKSHQSRPMKDAVKAAKLPKETVFYCLRHYYISKALLVGIPAQVVAENCGTSVRMIEKHYGKFMPKDRRAMLNQVKVG